MNPKLPLDGHTYTLTVFDSSWVASWVATWNVRARTKGGPYFLTSTMKLGTRCYNDMCSSGPSELTRMACTSPLIHHFQMATSQTGSTASRCQILQRHWTSRCWEQEWSEIHLQPNSLVPSIWYLSKRLTKVWHDCLWQLWWSCLNSMIPSEAWTDSSYKWTCDLC